MEKIKNYFSELKNKTNILVYSLIGLGLALLLFLLDEFNLPGLILSLMQFDSSVIAILIIIAYVLLFGGLLSVAVVLLLNILKSNINKADSILLSFNVFSLVYLLLVAIVLGEGFVKPILAVVMLIVGLVVLSLRIFRVKNK